MPAAGSTRRRSRGIRQRPRRPATRGPAAAARATAAGRQMKPSKVTPRCLARHERPGPVAGVVDPVDVLIREVVRRGRRDIARGERGRGEEQVSPKRPKPVGKRRPEQHERPDHRGDSKAQKPPCNGSRASLRRDHLERPDRREDEDVDDPEDVVEGQERESDPEDTHEQSGVAQRLGAQRRSRGTRCSRARSRRRARARRAARHRTRGSSRRYSRPPQATTSRDPARGEQEHGR